MAQLNSASDYGSEGYRFESCRGHLKQKVRTIVRTFLFFAKAERSSKLGEKQKSATSRRGGATFYFQAGAQRKGEANPVFKAKLKALEKNKKVERPGGAGQLSIFRWELKGKTKSILFSSEAQSFGEKQKSATRQRCGLSIFRRELKGKAKPILISSEAQSFGEKQKSATSRRGGATFYFQVGAQRKGEANPDFKAKLKALEKNKKVQSGSGVDFLFSGGSSKERRSQS